MTAAKVDSRIRAEFKEWAREIIARDRTARKYGQSQNTIGEIERALVRAFQAGNASQNAGAPSGKDGSHIVDWIEIPPRARNVLFSISLPLHIKKADVPSPQILIERVRCGQDDRWVACKDKDRKDARTFSSGGISPLIRLGLLSPFEGSEDRLLLTPKGVATCKEYWRRWDEHDPTLPIMSTRA